RASPSSATSGRSGSSSRGGCSIRLDRQARWPRRSAPRREHGHSTRSCTWRSPPPNMKEVEIFPRLRPRARDRAGMAVLLLVSFLVALAVAAPASASNAAIVVPCEKHYDSSLGHYVGTAGDDGTIAMWVYDSS